MSDKEQTNGKHNVVDIRKLNIEEDLKALKIAVASNTKQLNITIDTANAIIENYNKLILHQTEMQSQIENLNMDTRLMRNILNQLRGFFSKTFPSYMNEPHFILIQQLGDLLIDTSEEGLKKKKEFFEQAASKAKTNEQQKA